MIKIKKFISIYLLLSTRYVEHLNVSTFQMFVVTVTILNISRNVLEFYYVFFFCDHFFGSFSADLYMLVYFLVANVVLVQVILRGVNI